MRRGVAWHDGEHLELRDERTHRLLCTIPDAVLERMLPCATDWAAHSWLAARTTSDHARPQREQLLFACDLDREAAEQTVSLEYGGSVEAHALEGDRVRAWLVVVAAAR